MKKCFLLLTLTALLFSCTEDIIDTSSDANTDPTEDTVLVKRAVYTYLDGDIYISNYNYDGNRLLNITDENGILQENYIYENDLLTRVNYLWADAYTTLSYDLSNNTIEIIWYWDIDENPVTSFVTYNSNGRISVTNTSPDINTSEDILTIDSNGNVIKEEDDTINYVNTFTYDNKNNPFKNIYSKDIIQLLWVTTEYGGDDITGGYSNNITNWTETYQGVDDIETWEYIYNSDDYPTSATYFYGGIEDFTTEYFYE